MKQFAHKTRSLSLVPTAARRGVSPQETSSPSFRDQFDGWRNSAVPDLSTGPSNQNPAPEQSLGWRALTYTDITRVNRATVRESRYHRHWPVDVVEKFLLADVIKRKT